MDSRGTAANDAVDGHRGAAGGAEQDAASGGSHRRRCGNGDAACTAGVDDGEMRRRWARRARGWGADGRAGRRAAAAATLRAGGAARQPRRRRKPPLVPTPTRPPAPQPHPPPPLTTPFQPPPPARSGPATCVAAVHGHRRPPPHVGRTWGPHNAIPKGSGVAGGGPPALPPSPPCCEIRAPPGDRARGGRPVPSGDISAAQQGAGGVVSGPPRAEVDGERCKTKTEDSGRRHGQFRPASWV